MDVVPSLVGASDESCADISTGPSTPDSSPLFGPSLSGEIVAKQFTPSLNEVNRLQLDTFDAETEILSTAPSAASHLVRNVCFIGAGYVGGPTAAVIALHNPSIRVEVLDRDENRIQKWKSSHLPINEPGLEHVVRVARDGALTRKRTTRDSITARGVADDQEDWAKHRPNLFFTTDSRSSISKADIIFLGVNTPTKGFGIGAGKATNMAALDGAVKDLAAYARPGTIIVEKSTVPCGTAKRLDSLRPGEPFEILSNPEFLAEGSAIKNLFRPDRVIIGSSQTASGKLAASTLAAIYAAWVPRSKIVEINVFSSELTKLVANAMLAQRISSINSISAICDATGADVDEIAHSVGLDVRVGPKFLQAGLGFGGSCFRKDIASLVYLAETLGLDDVAHYWDQVNTMNNLQRHRFTKKVIRALDEDLVGKKICLLGFAFKKDTGDVRESPALDVIKTLLDERPDEIAICDLYCREEDIRKELDSLISDSATKYRTHPVRIYADPYQACTDADAVLVMTDCDQFRCLPRTCQDATPALAEVVAQDRLWFANGSQYHLPPRPACPTNCLECRRQSNGPVSSEPLEWARIAYSMRLPRIVLDGRGILNLSEMANLGFKVETLGRQSSVTAE